MSELATPTELAGLVDFNKGSVVSKTLVKDKAGNVTLFAFDSGEGLSEHSAPYDALVMGVAGSAQVRIGSEEHAVSSGQILRLPANVPHGLKATEPFKMLLVMIRSGA